MIARLFLAATLSLACTTLFAGELALTFPDGRNIALSSSNLAALKRESISATSHDIGASVIRKGHPKRMRVTILRQC